MQYQAHLLLTQQIIQILDGEQVKEYLDYKFIKTDDRSSDVETSVRADYIARGILETVQETIFLQENQD